VIVAMAGLPGTGKSSLARALAERLNGVVINKDEIRAAAFGPLIDYSAAQDDFCMELVYRIVAYLHETRPEVPVILDGRTYSRREQVARLYKALPETPRVIECVCDDAVARARLDADPHHLARNRNFSLYEAVKASADPLEVPRLIIDTGQTDLAGALARATAYLDNSA
jgi:predicted kinase